MGPTNERIDVNTSVAVRGGRGFFFGTLKWIHGERVLVEVDAELDPGETVDVRVTLGPGPGTALAKATVHRALVTGWGETTRYVLSVSEVAPDDRAALDAWIGNARARGTWQSFDAVSAAQPIAQSRQGATRAETRAALERMGSRGGGPPSGVSAGDPFGLRSDAASSGSARAAMRDALRKAIAAPPGAPPPARAPSPEPPPSIVSVAPASRPPASVPPSRPVLPPGASGAFTSLPPPSRMGLPPVPHRPPAAAPMAVPGGADPTYASTATSSCAWLEVRWSSPAAFADDVEGLLADPRVVLPNLGPPLPDRAPLRFVLRHDDFVLDCAGEVVEHGPFGATYRLALNASSKNALQAWREGYRRK
jgi:hypothetical protein